MIECIEAINIVLIINYFMVFIITVYVIRRQDREIKRLKKENLEIVLKLMNYERNN